MEILNNSYFKLLPAQVLNKVVSTATLPFSQQLFWDVNLDNLNAITHKAFLIERVITRGLLHDLYYLLQLYSTIEIIQALKKCKQLDKKNC
jgi:hypothetical protein